MSSARSYFACTLGQAARLPGHSWVSLNHLLDVQAEAHPDLPVVGMPVPKQDGEWGVRTLTYRQLLDASSAVAHYFTEQGTLPRRSSDDGDAPTTIGLLSHSSLDFVVTLFAAMRMGLSVLLIAPQCTPAAVSYLCEAMNVTHVVYELALHELAQEASHSSTDHAPLELVPLPTSSVWTSAFSERPPEFKAALSPEQESARTCFIYHSSGTSSGLPKPLPQNHRTMTVLHPRIPGAPACFSTTPLYHGGLADLVRSLNSEAMLYLFPPEVPITRFNILKSLEACERFALEQPSELQHHARIKYFSCVPYVLKMLVENDEGGASLGFLKDLDMIGTGGAPLPQDLGDRLMAEGVRLISRYGSAECGFLMSSARDFENDREWQYLRSGGSGGALVFEPQEDEGTAELVIQRTWPCMTKTNRPDGSFATGDLYSQHPSIPDAWKYLGRKDDMLVLVNGKKVDPVPFETALNAASPSTRIHESLVFGVNRAYVGVMIIPSASASDGEDELRTQAWSIVESVNTTVSGHARIPAKDMILVLPQGSAFSKSSKGTVQRPLVYKHFEDAIATNYDQFETGTSDLNKVTVASIEDAQEYILRMIREIASRSKAARGTHVIIDLDTDLFSYGVDSLQSARIRNRLQAEVELSGQELSSNIVYECATVRRLASAVYSKISGGAQDGDTQEDELAFMWELVRKYSVSESPASPSANGHHNASGRVLIITGVTGALGAHLLDQALHHPKSHFSEIVCLCRAVDDQSAYERVQASLAQRCLSALSTSPETKVTCLAARLGDDSLGLEPSVYEDLVRRATDIIHAAWAVNFIGGLRSFESNHIRGVHNLIRLASPNVLRTIPASFYFCSSGATVLGRPPSEPIPESIPQDPQSAAPMGYARSKWVAEHLCEAASRGPLSGHVSVLRIGQLCGDTHSGVWNESEGWPLMLRTVDEVGMLPDLAQDVLWLPIDLAASAIMNIVTSQNILSGGGCPVFHVMNPNPVSWSSVCDWLRQFGKTFEEVSPKTWVAAVSNGESAVEKNPSRKLLGLWVSQYGSGATVKQEPSFNTGRAVSAVPGLARACVDRALLHMVFKQWTKAGYLK